MKKILLLIAVIFLVQNCYGALKPTPPRKPPKFENMIIRFDPVTKKGRWECEFGILTATATVEQNLILESVGCKPAVADSQPAQSYGSFMLTPNSQTLELQKGF